MSNAMGKDLLTLDVLFQLMKSKKRFGLASDRRRSADFAY